MSVTEFVMDAAEQEVEARVERYDQESGCAVLLGFAIEIGSSPDLIEEFDPFIPALLQISDAVTAVPDAEPLDPSLRRWGSDATVIFRTIQSAMFKVGSSTPSYGGGTCSVGEVACVVQPDKQVGLDIVTVTISLKGRKPTTAFYGLALSSDPKGAAVSMGTNHLVLPNDTIDAVFSENRYRRGSGIHEWAQSWYLGALALAAVHPRAQSFSALEEREMEDTARAVEETYAELAAIGEEQAAEESPGLFRTLSERVSHFIYGKKSSDHEA